MFRTLWTAATGMTTQQTNIDVISNNLANVNNIGYKKNRAHFEDLIYQEVKPAGSISAAGMTHPTGIQVGLGSKVSAVEKVHSQGSFQYTGVELDIAIEGDGYFQFTLPNGEIAYTRNGSLKTDAEGNLVNANGYYLEPAITVPEDAMSITFGEDGTISVTLPGEEDAQEIGQLEITRFINPAGLKAIGKNLFQATGASGDPVNGIPSEDGYGSIAQNILEMSNVSVVDEMVNMITGQRAYEINSKAVQTGDEMLQIVNNLKR